MNELAGRGGRRFRKLGLRRKKIEAARNPVEGETTQIANEGGNEPVMRPCISVSTYCVIAVLAVLAEFQISAFTFQNVADFGSRGVALAGC